MSTLRCEPPTLYLASRSPRRRELLEQIGIQYQCVQVNVPEEREKDESPLAYVSRLARSKAQAGQQAVANQTIAILGSDTIVVCGQQVLEKPADVAEGVAMLLSLSGQTHEVMTAVSVCLGDKEKTIVNSTRVTFRTISESEAQAYWQTGEPADKAGGYGIQGLAAVFIEKIDGSYSGVMGLPLFETAQLLSDFNVPVWQVLPS